MVSLCRRSATHVGCSDAIVHSPLARPARWRFAKVFVRDVDRPNIAMLRWECAPEDPPTVPTSDCFERCGGHLLYVGISPATNRNPRSRQTLRSRIRYHFRGNAAGSTLRRTLGVLLERTSGHALRRVGSGERHTLTTAGETWLNDWLAAHALVCWREHPAPWELEAELMRTQSFPLNIQGNEHHAFYPTLRRIRAEALARARQLPVCS
jgi:GIY-YIG catalytic domain-containing protein